MFLKLMKFLTGLRERFNIGPIRISGTVTISPDSRDSELYRDGDHSLIIQTEMLMKGPIACLVYAESIVCGLPPYAHELIDAKKKAEILRNLETYYKRLNCSYKIVEQLTGKIGMVKNDREISGAG